MDKNACEISIIVPMYNCEKYLSRCIDSILAQTFLSFELLLIDDGSSDNTRNICTNFANRDNRIRYYYENNAGVSSARNYGLNLAKGEYITFIDADDYVDSFYLERLIDTMHENNCDIVISNAFDVTDEVYLTNTTEGCTMLSQKDAIIALFRSKMFSHVCWGNLYTRNVISNISFDKSLRVAEDEKFLVECICKANTVTFLNEKHYYYFLHDESTVNSGFTEKFFDEVNLYFELYDRFAEDLKIQKLIANKLFDYLERLITYKEIPEEQKAQILTFYSRALGMKCTAKHRRVVKYILYRSGIWCGR